MVANIYAFGAAKSDRDTDTNNNRAYSVVQLSQLTIWMTKQQINKSPKFRPPPSRLINSPPLQITKEQLGPPDSCTSLPLWLTQLGFSSFILNPISTLHLSNFQQTIHPAISPLGELTLSPLPLSQTPTDTLLFLWFNSISVLASRSQSRAVAERRRGRQTRLHQAVQEVFPLFLTAHRKRGEDGCWNSSTEEELCRLRDNLQLNQIKKISYVYKLYSKNTGVD